MAKMFSGEYPIVMEEDGYVYLDKDPEIFSKVITYLRNPEK